MTAAIELRAVSRTYGAGQNAYTALSDVSLRIERSESCAIVGKSGSGKSTLLHVMGLLDEPTSGAVLVGGRSAADLSERSKARLRNREFGFLFQQFFLAPDLSVLDNVGLPLAIAGTPLREQRRRAVEMLDRVGLADKAANAATALSGGQKQRVALARALVAEPSVVFADEPTGNLDSRSGAEVADLLFSVQRDRGITLVIVTHDDDLAARCGRSIHVRDGAIAEQVAV